MIVGLFVAVIGFAWSPFAAAFVASRRQENVVGAVIASAFYSVVSIFMWIFFVLDLADVHVSKRTYSVVQFVAYGYWFVALINFWMSNLVVLEPAGSSFVIITVTLLIGIGTWIVALARKCRFEESSVWDRFPRRVLIAPFVYSTLWSCIYIFRAATFKEMEWAVWLLILPNAGSIIWVFWSWPYGGFKRIGNPWRGGTG